MTLGVKVPALHAALAAARIPHAFGGALALAYWIAEPRGTRDIDVNVFLPVTDADRVLAALPEGVRVSAEDRARLDRDEQVRLWWDETPVDLFFDYAAIHGAAAAYHARKSFGDGEIPVLGPVELAIFKGWFNRMRDWADIGQMISAGTLDVAAVRRGLQPMVGADDERLARLNDVEARSRR